MGKLRVRVYITCGSGRVAIFGTGRVRVRISIIGTGTGRVAEMLDPHTSTGKTKTGTEVAHVTSDSDITFKVKRSKVNLQAAVHIVAVSRTVCL